MEVKVNNSEQNINLTLAQGENPINIQLRPSEPQDISVSLKPKSSPLEFAITPPIVRPIHFDLAPNVIKEIISGGSHLYDLYDVQADGNSVFGASADAVLVYGANGRWRAELPAELTITKNGEPVGTYKLRGGNQTIDIVVPTLVSQLSNDKGYVTEDELDLALRGIKGVQFFVVDVLPTPSMDTLGGIYLVRKSGGASGNYYEEYITITRGSNYVWEKIGDTLINLSGYATKEDLEDAVDESRGYTDNKHEEVKNYIEEVRQDVIASVEDTIETTTGLINSTQEHLAQVESDLQATGERLDAEAERLLNIKAELDGELTRVGVEIDETNASIESVAIRVDENSGTIGEVKETMDATNLTLTETVTKLNENTGNIVQLRNEMDGIDETIVSVIDSQLSDEDSQITQSIGLVVDNKTQSIELAVKAIREGTDESTVAWVGQKIDAADEEIKTSIETMIYGEGYTETQTIGQIIDGKKDEITTYVLQSEELVGEDGLISQSIDGAYTEWGIDSIKNSVSFIEGVLSEDGELINVSTRFSTIEQGLDSIQLVVGESSGYGGETILDKFSAISLEIDRIGLVVSEGSNYAAIVAQINEATGEGEVLIEADKIHLLGETVADQLTAQSATIGNLTLTNAIVSGTINANAGNIGGWQIGPANEKGTYLYGGNLTLSSQGYIKNQQGDKVHYTLNNDGSGSLADGNIWWDNEGALYFSEDAIVVPDNSDISQGKALAQLISDVSKVLSMFDIDAANNAVYVKGDRNFYAFGEITALGQGTGGSGGGSGEGGADLLDVWISIAGNTDAYKDYQVNASHLTAYLTRAQIQETYATKEDLENIDIPTLTESDPIFKASAAYGITSADIANWNSMTSNVGTITGIKMNGVTVGTSGVVDLGTVITAHQDLSGYATQSWVEGKGYITSAAIPTTYAWSAITGKPNTLGGYGITDAYTASTIDGKLSGYLPLSGGTISGAVSSPLNINTSATNEVGLRFNMSGSAKAWVGYTPNTGAYLYSYGEGNGTHKLGLTDAGVGFLDSNTLIHSGNIGSQSVNYATSAGSAATATRTRYIETQAYDGSKWYADEYRLYAKWVNANILGLEVEGGYPILVNQATKLQTARTLWGQSFDGTGEVNGNILITKFEGNASAGDIIFQSSPNINGFKISSVYSGWASRQDLVFYSSNNTTDPYTPSWRETMRITHTGNVGIGTTAPAYKLAVNGTCSSSLSSGSSDAMFYGVRTDINRAIGLGIGTSNNRGIYDNNLGWVFKITTSDVIELGAGYTVNVPGNIVASGEITALGSSSSSDIRLKNIVGRPTPLLLEDIAKLNVISFKWNHRENDKRLKIGLVAQEVQEILPELVGVDGSNFLTLDYSTFGGVVGVMNTKEILSVKSEVEVLKDRVSALENEMERRKIYG